MSAADDRNAFDYARDSINRWFRRHAWRNRQSGASRTTIVCDVDTGAVAALVALCATQIEHGFLPKPAQRNQPDPLPALLIGQLAVDRRYQGRGLARSLLWFALTTAVRFSRDVGCFGVLVHPLDDAPRVFYGRFGFEDLLVHPGWAMIVRMVDLEHNGFAGLSIMPTSR